MGPRARNKLKHLNINASYQFVSTPKTPLNRLVAGLVMNPMCSDTMTRALLVLVCEESGHVDS